MATYSDAGVPRDAHGNQRSLADTIYGILPARTLDLSSADLQTDLIHSKPSQSTKSFTLGKRKGTSYSDTLPQHQNGYWPGGNKPTKRMSIQPRLQKRSHLEIHQSTCLNLSSLDNAESDLWILPDFDDWEAEAEPATQNTPLKREGEWKSLVERAANSNRERLRRRLEGDGWDFVGGRYGEDGKVYEAECLSEESVDEEFDVVVLPVVAVS